MISSSSTFAATSNPEVEAERRRALRALLRNPLLPAAGETMDEYALVRRHFKWLKQWLAKFPAWSVHIDNEAARLGKMPADILDDTRPAVDRTSGTAFSKRRYVLLCLVLASLEQSERQTTLRRLAHAIMEIVATDREFQAAGILFDIGSPDQRRDFIHAIRWLVDRCVLRRLDGDERDFLNQSDSSDVLYDINRHVLAATLHLSRSASALETCEEFSTDEPFLTRLRRLSEDPIPASEDGRSQRIRSKLVRVLLDDPILYFHDLNVEEREYFEKHRGYLLHQISEATGLIAEVRGEGIAMVDDGGDLTDIQLPEDGTLGRLKLLLAQWFGNCSRNAAGAPLPLSAVEQHVPELTRDYGFEWHKDISDAGAEARLMEDALQQLRALRLIRRTVDGIVPLAACGRYAAASGDDRLSVVCQDRPTVT